MKTPIEIVREELFVARYVLSTYTEGIQKIANEFSANTGAYVTSISFNFENDEGDSPNKCIGITVNTQPSLK